MSNENVLVILAGGKGTRFHGDVPKQYTRIAGKKLLDYSIEEMSRSRQTDQLLVVLDDSPEEIGAVRARGLSVVPGGKDRAHSFQNALDHVKEKLSGCKKIIFHEAARPLVTSDVIDHYFELLEEYDYVESCKKINDSLGSYVLERCRREDYYLIQAPEAYRFSTLLQYYDCESEIYFAAHQFPSFIRGCQYFDIPYNIKLTSPEDLVMIEYLIERVRK